MFIKLNNITSYIKEIFRFDKNIFFVEFLLKKTVGVFSPKANNAFPKGFITQKERRYAL